MFDTVRAARSIGDKLSAAAAGAVVPEETICCCVDELRKRVGLFGAGVLKNAPGVGR